MNSLKAKMLCVGDSHSPFLLRASAFFSFWPKLSSLDLLRLNLVWISPDITSSCKVWWSDLVQNRSPYTPVLTDSKEAQIAILMNASFWIVTCLLLFWLSIVDELGYPLWNPIERGITVYVRVYSFYLVFFLNPKHWNINLSVNMMMPWVSWCVAEVLLPESPPS